MRLDNNTPHSRTAMSSNNKITLTRPNGISSSLRTHSKIGVVPRLPPIPSLSDHSLEQGVMGNALSVSARSERDETKTRTPTRTPNSPGRRVHQSSTQRSTLSSVSSPDSNEDLHMSCRKELKDSVAREKQSTSKVLSLQQIVEELKATLRERDLTIESLTVDMKEKEKTLTELLEKERLVVETTQQELAHTKDELATKETHINDIKSEHAKEIDSIVTENEKKMSELTVEKDKEISTRDEKLDRLKKQMADALSGNSWERQHQLDELTKELTRLQDETDLLRGTVKSMKGKQAVGCENCTGRADLKISK